jgi:hypothetical protein
MAYIETKGVKIRRKKRKLANTWKFLVCTLTTIIAVLLYLQTFSNYYVSPHPISGIIGGQYPDASKLHVNYFTMDIDTEKNVILLSFDLVYYDNGSYSVLLTLPYQIASYNESLSSADWYIKNASSGSVIMAVLNVNNFTAIGWQSTTVRVLLTSKDLLLDRTFETNTLILPFGGAHDYDMQQEINKIYQISPIGMSSNPFNGAVSVTVPYSAVGLITSLPIDHSTPTNNPQVQVLTFSINEFKTFQLQYINSQERYQFELSILLIGVLLGIAGPIWAELLIKGLTRITIRKES